MKTAEDIIRHHGVHARWDDEHGEAIEHTSLNAQDIQAIQLDALKEGMQRVMKIVGQHNTTWDKDIRQAILELSEKDL